MGNGIGTILASIGIPMLLDAIMGKKGFKLIQIDLDVHFLSNYLQNEVV